MMKIIEGSWVKYSDLSSQMHLLELLNASGMGYVAILDDQYRLYGITTDNLY